MGSETTAIRARLPPKKKNIYEKKDETKKENGCRRVDESQNDK